VQANRCQALAIIDFNPYDIAFNALPLFHSFGMTTSMIMILSGVRTFFYPSPLHFRIIPEVVYDVGATIMFGTDTFLAAYAANAHPYDFYSLRYVVAGAEKLKEKTRGLWLDKFGIRIFEGYGATEASPVIAVNTPMYYKTGTVGKLLPKIEHYVQPVEGIVNGGRLCIKGPNIMLGYMFPSNPGVIETPFVEGLGTAWYDTGDIVNVDSNKYVTILGRLKRFAKVAGEMVSFAAVEELAAKIDDKASHVATCIEDDKKGEQIILFTTSNSLARDKIAHGAKEAGFSELHIPKIIIIIEAIPVLASGKIDYLKINEMAKEYEGESEHF
jgi:acyl-[acyl-carrier-protein]-phospholipid O-acyltransferase/long-chain-fatty-acid--[acyl-carrier-protein] ligase